MGEADGAPDSITPGGDQRRHRRLEIGAGEAGQPCGISDLGAVAEHAQRARERRRPAASSRASRSSTVFATPRGTIAPISAAAAAVGSSPRAAASSSSSPSRNGLPPVTSIHASTKRARGSGPEARRDQSADRRARQRRAGAAARRRDRSRSAAASGASAGSSGRVARISASGWPPEPARDESERPHRRHVAPLKVVDHEHQRRVGRDIRGQPVEAVLPRITGVARRGRPAPTAIAGGAREHVGGKRGRARQPALTLVWRRPPPTRARTAGGRRRTGIPARAPSPGALSTRARAPRPRERACSSSRDLPMPAGPSITRTPPARCPTARSASRTRSSSCSRSSSVVDSTTTCRSMRPRRSYGCPRPPDAMFGGRCQGICPMCGGSIGGPCETSKNRPVEEAQHAAHPGQGYRGRLHRASRSRRSSSA